ncbi:MULTISPECIES: MFS transporter [Thermoanaerobacter]|uniref:Major facilitator superfamily MFS_1 n=2 Tax=Thermoanaerobacter TaxID=1754 RepID=E8URC8_THEBF|nr:MULTISPECIES: MFS transporter [Thermoanaerobacter]ADV80624.1 major facilitator superfamily MFS_1 [Thermoanaerobacter brockii subsp. finnii Ako-1]AEM77711.1 major facilitator superfamily MFS_1 [Thermoanaerobacter wiegelii Rt8.B1]HBW59873.1 MFS transporter [Thermoanaerobacter sp.]
MRKNAYTIAIIYLLMMLIGIVENVKGPLIINIKTFYGVDYTMMGLFLSAGSFGFILSTFLGGFLADKIGRKSVLISGLILIIAGILGIFAARKFIVFLIFAFVMNMGMGLLEIGINAVASIVFIVNQALMMNLLHFFYGVGAIISPNMTAKLLHINFSWQQVYLTVGAIVFILMLAALEIKMHGEEKHIARDKIDYIQILSDKRMWLFASMLGFYVASELGIGNWAVTFFSAQYKMDNTISSLYLGLFFATFTFGRLVGGFIVERIGYIKSLFIFSLVSSILIASGMAGRNFAFLISVAGFFYSIIFPTTIAIVMKEFKQHVTIIIAIILTISSTINMLANFLIGRLNDIFGVFIGFSAILIFMILVVFMSLILAKTETTDDLEKV